MGAAYLVEERKLAWLRAQERSLNVWVVVNLLARGERDWSVERQVEVDKSVTVIK